MLDYISSCDCSLNTGCALFPFFYIFSWCSSLFPLTLWVVVFFLKKNNSCTLNKAVVETLYFVKINSMDQASAEKVCTKMLPGNIFFLVNIDFFFSNSPEDTALKTFKIWFKTISKPITLQEDCRLLDSLSKRLFMCLETHNGRKFRKTSVWRHWWSEFFNIFFWFYFGHVLCSDHYTWVLWGFFFVCLFFRTHRVLMSDHHSCSVKCHLWVLRPCFHVLAHRAPWLSYKCAFLHMNAGVYLRFTRFINRGCLNVLRAEWTQLYRLFAAVLIQFVGLLSI